MENLIKCQRCWEWLERKNSISIVNNMRWNIPVVINEESYKGLSMEINYFCPECISIIENKS